MNIRYKIAGIVYNINSNDLDMRQDRVGFDVFEFRGDVSKYPVVNINIQEEPIEVPKAARILFDGENWSMSVTDSGVRYMNFYGNPEILNGWVAEMPESSFETVNIYFQSGRYEDGILVSPIPYPLGREIAMYRGLSLGGIMLHGGAAAYSGNGVLYTGPSGAGKSTMSRCLRDSNYDFQMMSDERPIISMIEGKYYACGTPWPSSEKVIGNYMAPLRSVMFLEQSPDNKLVSMEKNVAFKRIMKTICIPWFDKELVFDFINVINKVLDEVEIFEVHFRPDEDVADLVAGYLSKL